MPDANTDAQPDLSQNVPHDTPTVLCDSSNIISNSKKIWTKQRAVMFLALTANVTLTRIIVTPTHQINLIWRISTPQTTSIK